MLLGKRRLKQSPDHGDDPIAKLVELRDVSFVGGIALQFGDACRRLEESIEDIVFGGNCDLTDGSHCRMTSSI